MSVQKKSGNLLKAPHRLTEHEICVTIVTFEYGARNMILNRSLYCQNTFNFVQLAGTLENILVLAECFFYWSQKEMIICKICLKRWKNQILDEICFILFLNKKFSWCYCGCFYYSRLFVWEKLCHSFKWGLELPYLSIDCYEYIGKSENRF